MVSAVRMDKFRRALIVVAPVLGAAVGWVLYRDGPFGGTLSGPASGCAAVALVCAVWWMFECLPIAVVGLVPMAVLPLLGSLSHTEAARMYGHPMIWLLMGGCMLSVAMQRTDAHRRVAVTMVRFVGGGRRRMVFGFMLATAVLSMWISNSATALMMVPIAGAVLSQYDDAKLRTPMLLGIAYAASIGGMATPIGTPPNLVLLSYLEEQGRSLSFAQWMAFGIPVSVTLLPLAWLWITRNLKSELESNSGDNRTSHVVMPKLPPLRSAETRVMLIFAATAIAWMTRTGPGGGWPVWFGLDRVAIDANGQLILSDTTVAIMACLILFVCPAGRDGIPAANPDAANPDAANKDAATADDPGPQTLSPSNERLLDWPTAATIPWGIMLMFGGGLALGESFKRTGLSQAFGDQLSFVAGASLVVTLAILCLAMNFLTELTSSTATANLMMPVLGLLAGATSLPPETILLPATISCSCAFMLPVATAPNVVVFSAGGLTTGEMAKNGFVLNLVAAATIVTLAVVLL